MSVFGSSGIKLPAAIPFKGMSAMKSPSIPMEQPPALQKMNVVGDLLNPNVGTPKLGNRLNCKL